MRFRYENEKLTISSKFGDQDKNPCKICQSKALKHLATSYIEMSKQHRNGVERKKKSVGRKSLK